jgi:hypothetical protein
VGTRREKLILPCISMTPKAVPFRDAYPGAPFANEGSVVSQHDGTVLLANA